jgi:hypothetical protein
MSRNMTSSTPGQYSDYIFGIEQGTQHTIVAALINASQGGENSIFSNNLIKWEKFISQDFSFGRCELIATPANQSSYYNGIKLDWEVDGKGVSSAYADCTLILRGREIEVNNDFSINTTTQINISGSYSRVEGDSKEVSVIVELMVDGRPSLANSMTLEYNKSAVWRNPTELDSYQEQDYGNGTYRYTFTDVIIGTDILVRVQTFDNRRVFVQAEKKISEG